MFFTYQLNFTLSHFHFHTFTLSHFHFHTFTLSLLFSHFHSKVSKFQRGNLGNARKKTFFFNKMSSLTLSHPTFHISRFLIRGELWRISWLGYCDLKASPTKWPGILCTEHEICLLISREILNLNLQGQVISATSCEHLLFNILSFLLCILLLLVISLDKL